MSSAISGLLLQKFKNRVFCPPQSSLKASIGLSLWGSAYEIRKQNLDCLGYLTVKTACFYYLAIDSTKAKNSLISHI